MKGLMEWVKEWIDGMGEWMDGSLDEWLDGFLG